MTKPATSKKKRNLGQCTSTDVDRIAFRFYGKPTAEQKQKLDTTLDSCRWLYNRMLDDRTKTYEYLGETLNRKPAWYKHLSCCP